MSNCCANSASVLSPRTAAKATFALKAGVWFRRGRFVMVSPVRHTSWPLSGRNSTYPAVQISKASSGGGWFPHRSCHRDYCRYRFPKTVYPQLSLFKTFILRSPLSEPDLQKPNTIVDVRRKLYLVLSGFRKTEHDVGSAHTALQPTLP